MEDTIARRNAGEGIRVDGRMTSAIIDEAMKLVEVGNAPVGVTGIV